MNKGKVTGNPAAGPGPPMKWDPRYIYGIGEEGYKDAVGPSGQKSGMTGPRRGHPDDPGCIYRPLREEMVERIYKHDISCCGRRGGHRADGTLFAFLGERDPLYDMSC